MWLPVPRTWLFFILFCKARLINYYYFIILCFKTFEKCIAKSWQMSSKAFQNFAKTAYIWSSCSFYIDFQEWLCRPDYSPTSGYASHYWQNGSLCCEEWTRLWDCCAKQTRCPIQFLVFLASPFSLLQWQEEAVCYRKSKFVITQNAA